jgi:hypothetical protein
MMQQLLGLHTGVSKLDYLGSIILPLTCALFQWRPRSLNNRVQLLLQTFGMLLARTLGYHLIYLNLQERRLRCH